MQLTAKLFRVVSALASVVVLGTITISCSKSNPDQGDRQMTDMDLKAELESSDSISREEPFTVRPFEPYLDSAWIGNAVAYGCYRKGQAPGVQGPSDDELLEDLQIISRYWHLIRLYGADNDTRRILKLIDEHDLPIKVVQGVWLAPEHDDPAKRAANERQVLLAIELARTYPDIVAAISVGNETQVFWSAHQVTIEYVIRYIRFARQHSDVPVTTADDYQYWNKPESRQLAEEVDFVFTHLHPLWNGQTLDDAISWMDSHYKDIQALHPDRTIVLGETGWATNYNAEQKGPGQQGTLVKGAVGLDAQAEFLVAVDQWTENNKVATFLFEVFDESWKGGGESTPPNEIEKNWGLFYEDRTPKESFERYLDHTQSVEK